MTFSEQDGRLVFREGHLTMWVEPWGADAIRVRATMNARMPDAIDTLVPPAAGDATIDVPGRPAAAEGGQPNFTAAVSNEAKDKRPARVISGTCTVEVHRDGTLAFSRTGDGAELLTVDSVAKGVFRPRGGSDLWQATLRCKAYDDEKIYGMGQHRHGRLDQKGCVIDLVQHNCEVNIPFAVSSRGYGFIWNNPAIGRAEFAHNGTRWTAEATAAVDFVVLAGGAPADILARYADCTGHAPMLPEFAAGFWQCKLRYETQEQLLAVAREHVTQRKLPMDVIVSDFFHWTRQGEWKFDPEDWPDVPGMVKELSDMGVRLMVSVWPTVSPEAEDIGEMQSGGMLLQTDHGLPVPFRFIETKREGAFYPYFIDPSNPAARDFVWRKVRENYYAHGIKVWWLDAIEPELGTAFPDVDNLRYHAGPGAAVGCLYPWYQQKLFFEGMKSEGETDIITLCRSAFLGSQRFGAAVWSGDIFSSFEVLAGQIRAGLNIAMSGIAWWTTDIGGFWGGYPENDDFRELIVRWFQYGVFCPLFRLHGARAGSGDNEVWSFGEPAYEIISAQLALRERLRPYIMQQMKIASDTGLPPMRPLFVDFPDDAACWAVDDQFLFGPDILVAPIVEAGASGREVYLPAGATWKDAFSGEVHDGGQRLAMDAPLARIPVLVRDGSDVTIYE